MMRTIIFLLFNILFFSACSTKNEGEILDYTPEVFTGKWLGGKFLTQSERFLLFGEQGTIALSADGENWHNVSTPVAHALQDLATNTQEKTLITVGERATILRSIDHGNSWKKILLNPPANADLSNTRLNKIIYHEQSKAWIAAGTQNAILRSTDDGSNWTLLSFNEGEDQQEILDLFIEKYSGDILFAAQFATTGRSKDGGVNWEIRKHDLQAVGHYIPHIVRFHQFNTLLIATADHGHLMTSRDAGDSWTLHRLPTDGYFSDAAFDPETNSIVLTTQMGEIVTSQDQGESWTLRTFEVANWPSEDIPYLSQIHFDKETRSFIIVGNSGVIARSNDGGATWFADIFKPFLNLSITSLLHSPEKNIYVAAGLGGVIATSQNTNLAVQPTSSWQIARPGIDQYIREIIHLPNSNTFMAVGQLGGIWRSTDDGDTWSTIKVKYPFNNQPPHLRDVFRDPETGALLAVGPVGTVMRSADKGLSWESVFQGKIHLGEAFTQILYNSKTKTYLLCEVLYRSVYQSTDAGRTWEKVTTIESNDRNLWHGAISQQLGLAVLIGQKGGIAVSRDDGHSWVMADTKVYNDLYGAYADADNALLFAVGKNGTILRSTDGENWQSINSGTAHTLRRVAKDPKSGALLAFGQGGTIVRSTDEGRSWLAVEKPLNYEGELRTLVLEAHTNNMIVVGRDGGILRSHDSGLSWQMLESHTTKHLRSAAANPNSGTLVSVGEALVKLRRNDK